MRIEPSLLALSATALAGLWLAGCGELAGRKTASTASASTAGPVGPLHRKALDFEATMQAQHLPYGQVQDVTFDAAGDVAARGGPSRCIWTAAYAAAQCMRWRTTGDPVAHANMERSLWALHGMHEITGQPGVISRGFDEPRYEPSGYPGHGAYAQFNFFPQQPSRDQYAGWFHGVGFCYDDVRDPALRAALAQDVRDIADLMQAGDLEVIGQWNGQQTSFFDLKPDYAYQNRISAQTWATVDDFPFNLITQAVPYDPLLAQAISQARIPPIRASEALKAVLVFTVAEHVTGDPRYARYKDELLFTRDYAGVIERHMNLIDDFFAGRNRPVVEATIEGVFRSLGGILEDYLRLTGKHTLLQQLSPYLFQALGTWVADAAVRLVDYLNDPNDQARRAAVLDDLRLLAFVLRVAGQPSLAQKIEDFVNGPGALLGPDGLRDFANGVRSYLGVNLNVMPLSTLIELERDPRLLAVYQGAIEGSWSYIAQEHDPVTNLIHAGYVAPGPDDVAHSLAALTDWPVDMRMRKVDNGAWPGLVRSPWPDRLGNVGNLASKPLFFPISRRAPSIFPWRLNPREIVTGSDNPLREVAPLGYLFPYWVGRYRGLIRPDQ